MNQLPALCGQGKLARARHIRRRCLVGDRRRRRPLLHHAESSLKRGPSLLRLWHCPSLNQVGNCNKSLRTARYKMRQLLHYNIDSLHGGRTLPLITPDPKTLPRFSPQCDLEHLAPSSRGRHCYYHSDARANEDLRQFLNPLFLLDLVHHLCRFPILESAPSLDFVTVLLEYSEFDDNTSDDGYQLMLIFEASSWQDCMLLKQALQNARIKIDGLRSAPLLQHAGPVVSLSSLGRRMLLALWLLIFQWYLQALWTKAMELSLLRERLCSTCGLMGGLESLKGRAEPWFFISEVVSIIKISFLEAATHREAKIAV
eukprot:1271279-Amphidinium_carterae.1